MRKKKKHTLIFSLNNNLNYAINKEAFFYATMLRDSSSRFTSTT